MLYNLSSSGNKRRHNSTQQARINKTPKQSVETSRAKSNKEPLKTPAKPKSLKFLLLLLFFYRNFLYFFQLKKVLILFINNGLTYDKRLM